MCHCVGKFSEACHFQLGEWVHDIDPRFGSDDQIEGPEEGEDGDDETSITDEHPMNH